MFNDFQGNLIIIFDSCYSGGMAKGTDISPDKNGIDGDHKVVLMSSRADKKSGSDYYLKELCVHGVFTHYLWYALTHPEKDDRVSAEEAFHNAKKYSWELQLRQDSQIRDNYLTEDDSIEHCYFSPTPLNKNYLSGEGGSSIHIHAYDSIGRHVGIKGSSIENEIPGAYYSGPDFHPEVITILNKSSDVTYKIQGTSDETFNFTLTQSTETKATTVTYLDVPITETTEATVAVSKTNPTYTMEIDNNGDGITDYTNEPDSIETIGDVSETKTCKVQITSNPSLQDRPSIVHVNGNYYIAYQSHEKGYAIYIKEFDSNWNFKKKVEVASGSAYYDSPSLLFANNKLYCNHVRTCLLFTIRTVISTWLTNHGKKAMETSSSRNSILI
jgi:hypothetical protein